MNTDEATKLAAQYQDSLARAKFDQETQRDKTLVLISGGAPHLPGERRGNGDVFLPVMSER
jgi:hypothetical protein